MKPYLTSEDIHKILSEKDFDKSHTCASGWVVDEQVKRIYKWGNEICRCCNLPNRKCSRAWEELKNEVEM